MACEKRDNEAVRMPILECGDRPFMSRVRTMMSLGALGAWNYQNVHAVRSIRITRRGTSTFLRKLDPQLATTLFALFRASLWR